MPRSSFQRPSRVRATGPKLLIACEGDGEKAYLEAIRQSLRLSDRQIVVLNQKGTDPLSVVRTAIEYRKGLKSDGAWLKGDSAWAAFGGYSASGSSEGAQSRGGEAALQQPFFRDGHANRVAFGT